MHIALLHYAAPPVVGGVERVLAEHARLMVEAGHQVTVVAGRGEAWSARITLHRVPRVDSRHPEVLAVKKGLDAGAVPPEFGPLAAAILEDLSPALVGVDLLVAHNVGSLHKNLPLTAALVEMARRNSYPPIVLWHHDLAWTSARYRADLHPGWPWDLLRTHWADRHVVVSEARRRELAALLDLVPTEIHVVPNGIDADALLAISPDTGALVAELGLADAAPLLLLPARLTARKNVELALDALAPLRRVMPDAQLLVTGPVGPHNPANQTYLTQLVERRDQLGLRGAAHLLAEARRDVLSDRGVADLYRLADALVLPSFEEGFGIPVLEAAVARRPVFAADIASLRELGGGAVSWFDPYGPPEALAELIANRLNADPSYRLALHVRRTYTWSRIYQDRIAPVLGL
jgi:glycosyltransferase involved in cell wall biosynthesis